MRIVSPNKVSKDKLVPPMLIGDRPGSTTATAYCGACGRVLDHYGQERCEACGQKVLWW